MVDDLTKWLALLSLLLSIGNIVWAWISRPARDLGKRIDDVEDQALEELKKHDRRIQRVEDEMRHLPTKDDVQRDEQQVTAIKTELDMVTRTVNRIDDFLRSGGK